MKKIILASTSPRRKALLEKAGVVFDIEPSNYEEEMHLPMPPAELAKYLSRKKAESVASAHLDALVISADTFIAHEGKVLGKPHTPERAKETLRDLSGKAHSVITGFTVIEKDKVISQSVETKVFFRELSDEEIEKYIATGEPLERAGAYAIQELGGALIEKIEGDYDNVVGLPVEEVIKVLREEFGMIV